LQEALFTAVLGSGDWNEPTAIAAKWLGCYRVGFEGTDTSTGTVIASGWSDEKMRPNAQTGNTKPDWIWLIPETANTPSFIIRFWVEFTERLASPYPDQSSINALGSLFGWAMAKRHSLLNAQFENATLIETVLRLKAPTLLVRGDGDWIFINGAAREALHFCDLAQIAQDPNWEQTCRQSVRTGQALFESKFGMGIRLTCTNPADPEPGGLLAIYKKAILVGVPFALEHNKDWREIMKARYDLSFTELEVVAILKTGASPAEIARLRHSSIQTIRQHLKNIRRKTGARSLVGILALIP
jgi:DNA-binding CsgD family transcriptional regulator